MQQSGAERVTNALTLLTFMDESDILYASEKRRHSSLIRVTRILKSRQNLKAPCVTNKKFWGIKLKKIYRKEKKYVCF